MKKILSFALVMIMLLFALPAVKAEAKIKPVRKTVYTGDKLQLQVWFGGTVKWINTTKKLCTVTSKGVFTAKKPGKAVIIGRTSRGGDAQFIIRIKKDVSKKLVKHKIEPFDKGAVITITNKNTEGVTLRIDTDLLDASGEVVKTQNDSILNLGPKMTTSYMIRKYSTDGEITDYKANIEVRRSSYQDGTKFIKIANDAVDGENVVCDVTNTGKRQVNSVYIGIIYYDADKKIIGFDDRITMVREPGSKEQVKFPFPKNLDYQTVTPASYKLFVKNGYIYN